jgi:hypothetical protein
MNPEAVAAMFDVDPETLAAYVEYMRPIYELAAERRAQFPSPPGCAQSRRSTGGEAMNAAEPICGRCGRPAEGLASIDGVRYCHGDTNPAWTCYMTASYLQTSFAGPNEMNDLLARIWREEP